MRALDLGFDLKAREERDIVAVELQARQGRGHDVRQVRLRLLVELGVIDDDLTDVRP